MQPDLTLLAAILVGIVSSARVTRLVTQDGFPPTGWIRDKWDLLTEGSDWNLLFHCHWCFSAWSTLGIGAWGWFSELHISWWAFNGWLAASYVAAMIVERDEVE